MRVAVACSGLGRVHRGFERFALELGSHLSAVEQVDTYGTGAIEGSGVQVVRALHRDSAFLRAFPMSKRSGHYWEALTFSGSLARRLVRGSYDIVHVVDPPVMNFLGRLRDTTRGHWRLVFSNGVGLSSDHCSRADHVHQVSPHPYEVALRHGIDPNTMTLLPHAVDCAALDIPETKDEARKALGLPSDGTIALHVSSLNRDHKRTDYAIREVAMTKELCLLAVGRVADPSLIALGREMLGPRFIHRTLPFHEMPLAYRSADLFVHTALFEGFGLSLVEAMAASLPLFAHDDMHFRWLLKYPDGLIPMNVDGALGSALRAFELGDNHTQVTHERRLHAFDTYSWDVLTPRYVEMYRRIFPTIDQ